MEVGQIRGRSTSQEMIAASKSSRQFLCAIPSILVIIVSSKAPGETSGPYKKNPLWTPQSQANDSIQMILRNCIKNNVT